MTQLKAKTSATINVRHDTMPASHDERVELRVDAIEIYMPNGDRVTIDILETDDLGIWGSIYTHTTDPDTGIRHMSDFSF